MEWSTAIVIIAAILAFTAIATAYISRPKA